MDYRDDRRGGRRDEDDLMGKVYVGDIPRDLTENELDKEFSTYGKISKVWVARNPPGFAFIHFEDQRDAEDAIKGMDGQHVFGGRIRVEASSGRRGGRGRGGFGGGRGPPHYDSYNGGGYRGGGRGGRGGNCFKCGEPGHIAIDCRGGGGGGGRDRYRDSDRDRSDRRSSSGRRRSYSRSRSRSPRRRRSSSRD